MCDPFQQYARLLDRAQPIRCSGRVREIMGLSMIAEGLFLPIGAMCRIDRPREAPVEAQVVAASGDRTTLMTLQEPLGIAVGSRVTSCAGLENVPVGQHMLGAVLDGFGRPVGGRTDFPVEDHYPVFADAPAALSREPISDALPTGIRAIDAMHTIGRGQRVGIFAGTGVGKSVLLGMIARYTQADVVVVGLIGERGREVGDFLRKDLGDEGMRRCVMVVSTSNESPVLRVRAGFVATAVAEYFRDQGRDVLLLMDSTTRMAMAQRQIGLASGEPPATKGYPPSVFALLPRLLERSGRTAHGSITGLYTVLVEGDDINEPVADAIRGVLDGHLWLSRSLANRGHYPAISVLESISRVMSDVANENHLRAAATLRRVMAVWNDIEDLVNVGAYAPGMNPDFDVAVRMKPEMDEFLRQAVNDRADYAVTRDHLIRLSEKITATRKQFGSTTRPTAAA